jgi:hypothetical protein
MCSSSSNPFRVIVPILIALVSLSVCGVILNDSSDYDSRNSYDGHAKKIALATILMFVLTIPGLSILEWIFSGCFSSPQTGTRDNDPPCLGVLTPEGAVCYSLYTSSVYFFFSTVYAIYAVCNDMITSTDRNSYNRSVSMAIAISAVINWSLLVILIISEYIAYRCQLKDEYDVETPEIPTNVIIGQQVIIAMAPSSVVLNPVN